MVLGHDAILENYRLGNIIISPFTEEFVSVNSYDVRLGEDLCHLREPCRGFYCNPYDAPEDRYETIRPETILSQDAMNGVLKTLGPSGLGALNICLQPEDREKLAGQRGWILQPGIYLGSTVEEIGTAAGSGLIPDINAKSTFGRNGLTVALCAGKGDVGYAARWTLEIHVRYPTLLLVGTVIGQVRFSRCEDAGVYGGEGSYQPGGQIRMLPKPMKVVP